MAREAFCLLAGAQKQAIAVVQGLEVDPKGDAAQHRDDRRPGDERGGDDGPGPYIGREHEHDLVYDLRQSLAKSTPLVDLLAAHLEVAKHLDRAALLCMLDPANYLGQCG